MTTKDTNRDERWNRFIESIEVKFDKIENISDLVGYSTMIPNQIHLTIDNSIKEPMRSEITEIFMSIFNA
ncbi:hypothetical protein [Draconibacterium mangrovi]|uniref:hypothetical protein n=1 Tax=Draconibacterium mangrovi TaxID=2697469 RepID=UPI0013D10823|nr:hypothetical protein [Draconibacterium mangrovi]